MKKFQNLRKEEIFLRICLEKFVQIQNSKNHISHEDFHHLELLEQKISHIQDEGFRKKLQFQIWNLQRIFSKNMILEDTEKSLRFSEIEDLCIFLLREKYQSRYLIDIFHIENLHWKVLMPIGIIAIFGFLTNKSWLFSIAIWILI